MDIAKIRKKIKKLEEAKGREIKQPEQEKKPERSDSQIETSPAGINMKPEEKQSDRPEAEPVGKTGSSELTDASAVEKSEIVEEAEILAFKVADEEYAVKMTELQEIIRYQRITAVPCSPKYLIGITSLRGKILPVVDLKIRLGLTGGNGDVEKQKIIILSGKKELLGALVSSILGVFRLPVSDLLSPPSTLTEEEKSFIESVAKIKDKFISVLNVDEITKVEIL